MRRRQFMTLGATAAVLAAGGGIDLAGARPAAAAGPSSRAFPRTEVERHAAGSGWVRPAAAFDHVAVRADVPGEEGRIRFEGVDGPGEWQALHFGEHGRDDLPAAPAALVAAPAGAVAYEVRLPGGRTAETLAVNTRDGAALRVSGEATGRMTIAGGNSARGGFSYLTRAGWGADESLRYDEAGQEVWPREYYPVQALTVHHAAMPVAADPRETVRAIYDLHAVQQTWGDIGYHLLIDPAGTVYEGRYTRENGLPIFEGLPVPGRARSVTAGHVGGYNSGNIGVCLLGDFTDSMPTPAAQDSLVLVLRVLARLTGVDPVAQIEYVNPVNGATWTGQGLSRHRDWLATECPGNTFAARFEEIRSRVAAD
ncbi:peptidoglycan recognition protein family protein [Marinitenerispora sediminis]|uniref:N-acetylmuramoyl-L-alanine amidase n=1 Tax=Marinitenerispora sediminis TaxID=1931232 RepID=A0A368T206_9ACTN|nr:peptidoglycan recognition family protein [Marinitenerispora sediminis]RCV55134.1 N-acetylmuramoyl-L-alanine amidase [Marinitenerispora sediminis]RCV55456.1 N-acetylmuramoyl-L-alanine amidase [Marinitenerispora sediminis]RCV61753.1 N-acetylmuramoyl-L-alanine amidase [Marinitenerispora sediminis]